MPKKTPTEKDIFKHQKTKMKQLADDLENEKRLRADAEHKLQFQKEQLNDLQDRYDKFRASKEDFEEL